MIMNLLILLILATLVSFVDTTLMVLPSSQSPDSNCCVNVAEILAELHRQPDPRSNQHVIIAGPCNQHSYKSPTPLTKAEINPTYLFQYVASAPKITTQRYYCSGLLDERIEEHSKVSLAYCHKAFTKFKGVWRSNNCKYDAPDTSDPQRSGWNKTNGFLHCPSCLSTKKNIYRHIAVLEKEPTTILPPSSSIKTDIANNLVIEVGKYENKKAAFKAFKSDDGVKEAMIVLAGRGDDDIKVQLNSVNHRIHVCESFDCNCIMVKEKRDHSSYYCDRCRNGFETDHMR